MSEASTIPVTIIRPRRGWISIDWAELWRYRELFAFLVWRDISVRYKQTVLGVAWAVIQPVLTMLVFTVIFGKLAKIDTDPPGIPYAVFVYAGILPWQFFSSSMSQAGSSLVAQSNLLTKVYVPRLMIPISRAGVSFVDLAISSVVYGLIISLYHFDVVGDGTWGFTGTWSLAALPLLLGMTAVAAMGFGVWLAALTVSYRDFNYVVPFITQALMYLSPVIYPVSLVPEGYQWLAALNPMMGLIDGYRSAILGDDWNPTTLAVSSATAVVVFLTGIVHFRRTERRFADVA